MVDFFNSFPLKKKCIHVVALNNWEPELCAITLPNLREYAKRIGADFNLITKAKFNGFPPNYERFQIWEAGLNYFWNLNIDADTLIHPEAEDPTERLQTNEVASLWGIAADFYFKDNIYFKRDGRNQGISDNFTVSSWVTHDFWKPLDMSYEEMGKHCLKEKRQVSEFNLSVNLARFGLKHTGALVDHSKHYSLMFTSSKMTPKEAVEKLSSKLKEWGL